MKIAQISTIASRVPPKGHGGTERIVHALTEELVKRGHEVTLFASGDSITSAKLDSVWPINLRETDIEPLYGINTVFLHHLGHAYRLGQEFDIIHDHTGCSGLPFAELSSRPVVMTMHGLVPRMHQPLFKEFKKANLVAISHDQQQDHMEYNTAGVVHNGLMMEKYPFSLTHKGYLLYVGQISEAKGARYAIEAAKKLNLPLIIAARLDKREKYQTYYKTYIEPYLSDTIRYIGEVGEEERNELMAHALCFLHPGTWREPFGLTLIESMACGAPVIAFNKGAIPEIVEEGKTGFVVENVDEMVEAIGRIETIDRAYCREYALKNFSASRMADQYEQLYKKLLEAYPLESN
ncbi:MAG: glycosyltransferase family 4 protein [Patescibacteria group bacterium]